MFEVRYYLDSSRSTYRDGILLRFGITGHALLSDQIVAELGGDPLEGDKQGCVGERPIEDW